MLGNLPLAFPTLLLVPLVLLPPEGALLLLLVSALVLGLPHGAADLAIGPRLMPFPRFLFLYLLLTLPPLLLLLFHPPLALWAFLLLAFWHWGRGEERGALGFLRAGLVLFLPFLKPEAIRPFLEAFAGGYSPPPWVALLPLLLLPWALKERHPRASWADTALLALLGLLLHPYALLGGYFILHHSYGHLRRLQAEGWLGPGDRVWVWLGTLGGLALGLALYPLFRDALAAYMGAVFALTLPHALLVGLWEERVRFAPRGP